MWQKFWHEMTETATAPANNIKLLMTIGAVLIVLALSDMTAKSSVEAQKQVPPAPKFSSKLMGPTIKFLYWCELIYNLSDLLF